MSVPSLCHQQRKLFDKPSESMLSQYTIWSVLTANSVIEKNHVITSLPGFYCFSFVFCMSLAYIVSSSEESDDVWRLLLMTQDNAPLLILRDSTMSSFPTIHSHDILPLTPLTISYDINVLFCFTAHIILLIFCNLTITCSRMPET